MTHSLPNIGGDRMDRSIADFVQACRVLLMHEQEKIAPDNSLIAVLCDAVRLTREMEVLAKTPIQLPSPSTDEAVVEKAAERLFGTCCDNLDSCRAAVEEILALSPHAVEVARLMEGLEKMVRSWELDAGRCSSKIEGDAIKECADELTALLNPPIKGGQ